jgi:uncharacterized protein (TIGR02266 family)
MDLAAPIAQSMGALMNIERSGQLMPHADVALTNTRTALQSLQQHANVHPAVGQAIEAVASSLSHVHTLWKLGQPQAAPVPQAPPAYAPPPPQAAPAFPTAAADPFAPTRAQPMPPQYAAPQAQGYAQPAPAAPAGMGGGGGPVINADLGTQSPTNFYKGLSGNDIIDHGGLFVSTYMVPKIGTSVRLKVSLPGGYEFEANAVVAWSREASDAGNDAPPGFGAKFTQITPEARQLVYRYVRNREPLFHDDL